MLNINIVCIGKIKEKYLQDAIAEYSKRLSNYCNFKIVELPDEKDSDINFCLSKEKDLILKNIKDKDNIIILDIEGKEYSSIEFSYFINNELTYNSNITFIIGSSNGLHDDIKKLANKKISFSRLTFPHQLFRAFKIANNETYHW